MPKSILTNTTLDSPARPATQASASRSSTASRQPGASDQFAPTPSPSACNTLRSTGSSTKIENPDAHLFRVRHRQTDRPTDRPTVCRESKWELIGLRTYQNITAFSDGLRLAFLCACGPGGWLSAVPQAMFLYICFFLRTFESAWS